MTEKLYYQNAYLKEFEAKIISCFPVDGGYDTVLDRTAFFPEEGGQSSDSGKIGSATVLHVYEKDGIVHHITDSAPESDKVSCTINFEERFDKMQCHTAEHILCGTIHKLFGLDNVGFHIGESEVTFDISRPLAPDELARAEELANRVVFSNLKVEAYFPSAEELQNIEYRSKLDLTENVRLVKIGDVDICACCAPHVAYTGEVGLIKIVETMKHRGGMRIWIVAGNRALSDYRSAYLNLRSVSAALSVPRFETAAALEKYVKEAEQLKQDLKSLRKVIAETRAEALDPTMGNSVVYFPDFGMDELRAFVNAAGSKVSGILVALCGAENDLKYLIVSNSVDLSSEIKKINSTLGGRGGGKPCAVQGSFTASLDEIRTYFLGQK